MGPAADRVREGASSHRAQMRDGCRTGAASDAASMVDGAGATLTPAGVMALQRLAGNRAVTSLVRRAGGRVIQRLAYTDPPTTWASTITIKRSEEGLEGVYFVRDGTDQVVVKPLADTATVEYASRFMEQGMGLDAPQSRTYSKLSTEGREITRLFTTKPIQNEKKPGEAKTQIDNANYWLVMSTVRGTSIQKLDDAEATKFINDDDALKAVGKIMVADAFLGNEDRLVGMKANLGNFFYAVASGVTPGVVRTIDNEARFPLSQDPYVRGSLKKKLDIVENLLDTATPHGRQFYLGSFLAQFKSAHRNHPNTLLAIAGRGEAAIKNTISDGIDDAFRDVALVFKQNIDLVRAVAVSPEAESRAARDPGSAKAIAHYIRARVRQGLTQNTAADQLKHYFEYRARRNKAPAGLKWVTRVFSDVGFSFA
jgi:hypothetical protein